MSDVSYIAILRNAVESRRGRILKGSEIMAKQEARPHRYAGGGAAAGAGLAGAPQPFGPPQTAEAGYHFGGRCHYRTFWDLELGVVQFIKCDGEWLEKLVLGF